MLVMSIIENYRETGRLHFAGNLARRLSSLKASVIDISSGFAFERDRAERFIQDIYRMEYDASINVSYPILMSVRDVDGKILAATGFRYADQGPLFLEKYIGGRIEDILSNRFGIPVYRQEIAEIGNMASNGGGASVFLFSALSSYLNAKGIKYAAVTGTDALYQRFVDFGLSPDTLCDANPSHLSPDERDRWGKYYDTHPRVLSGSVEKGVKHLQKALGTVYETLPPLYTRLHFSNKF